MMVSVLIGSADSFVRRGIRSLLDTSFPVVAEACNGEELVRFAGMHKPDLVITDVSLPLLSGVEAAYSIRETLPESRFVFLGVEAHYPPRIDSLRASGTAYVNKTMAEALLPAIQAVVQGECWFTSEGPTLEGLSERQGEILKMIAHGRSNKEMAEALDISVKTVEFHRARLVRKLGKSSVADLTRLAMLHGLLESEVGVIPLLVLTLAFNS